MRSRVGRVVKATSRLSGMAKPFSILKRSRDFISLPKGPPAERLALALDSVRNNASLVIVFRFQGRTLLFPGDAQWGNWQSWIGTDAAKQLLSEVDFLKVAHHGSENATPVDVVNALKRAGLAEMVPTQVNPFPTIPRMPLLTALEKRCAGHVAIRSDWIDVEDAPEGPTPKPHFRLDSHRGRSVLSLD